MTTIVHVIAEYSRHEAMGRTVQETATRIPGRHHLVTARAHDGTDALDQVVELGGSIETFPARRDLERVLGRLAPDIIHLHGGALAPLLAAGTQIRHHPAVLSMYAWPTMPNISDIRKAGLRATWSSNVLRPRVIASTLLPSRIAARAIQRTGIKAILSPDPSVHNRLRGLTDLPIYRLGSGAPVTSLRATPNPDSPTVIFAGRSESVRGIDTLVEAFPAVLRQVPRARLRLLLIPRPELPEILANIERRGLGSSVDVTTEPVDDLLTELASSQVGCWPFKFDYTTSPPAMAVTEALSVGLPVVATDVGCIRSAVSDGAGAELVAPMRPGMLAERLIRLLTNEQAWHRHAAVAPDVVARMSWDAAARSTRMAYSHVSADLVGNTIRPQRSPTTPSAMATVG